jgi:hypothetical protein
VVVHHRAKVRRGTYVSTQMKWCNLRAFDSTYVSQGHIHVCPVIGVCTQPKALNLK